MDAVQIPGEPPKSLSVTRLAGGTVQISSCDSDGLSLMIEKPLLDLGPLPVVTQTAEPSLAGLDHMLAPRVPAGVVQNVPSSAPVAWLKESRPARTSGLSQ